MSDINEEQFVKFFTLLGTALFLLGNFSVFTAEGYSRRLAAESMVLSACEGNGNYSLATRSSCAGLVGETESIEKTDCSALDSDEKVGACRRLKGVLTKRINECEASGTYTPTDPPILSDACGAFGL